MENLDYDSIMQVGKAYTIEDDEGEVLIIFGMSFQWQDRALAWSFISEKAGKHFLAIHREVVRQIEDFQKYCRRLEMTVDVDFRQAHRWAKLLGFSVEGYLRAYRPDGGDVIMYSRIR